MVTETDRQLKKTVLLLAAISLTTSETGPNRTTPPVITADTAEPAATGTPPGSKKDPILYFDCNKLVSGCGRPSSGKRSPWYTRFRRPFLTSCSSSAQMDSASPITRESACFTAS